MREALAAGRRALSSNLHHLPDRQAETTPLQVHVNQHGSNPVAYGQDVRWVGHELVRQLTHVHQPLDTLGE